MEPRECSSRAVSQGRSRGVLTLMTAVPNMPGVLFHDWRESTCPVGQPLYCVRCDIILTAENARGVCPGPKNGHAAAPAFDGAVSDVLGSALTVCKERGGQYADTWALENQVSLF